MWQCIIEKRGNYSSSVLQCTLFVFKVLIRTAFSWSFVTTGYPIWCSLLSFKTFSIVRNNQTCLEHDLKLNKYRRHKLKMCVHYNNENVKFEKPTVKSVYISENHFM